jgi:hypothetical protein
MFSEKSAQVMPVINPAMFKTKYPFLSCKVADSYLEIIF